MPPLYELRARIEPALAERILGYVRRVPGRTISEFLIEAALRFGRLERRQGIKQITGTKLVNDQELDACLAKLLARQARIHIGRSLR
jgi:hypothetical protein